MRIYIILFISLLLLNSYASTPSANTYVNLKIDERQSQNLHSICILYGYARYFYPNEHAEKFTDIDWYKFLIYAIDKTINSNSEAELKENLLYAFSPIVNELTFDDTLTKPDLNRKQSNGFYYWKHKGIGVRPGGENIYSSNIEYSKLNSLTGVPVPDSLYGFRITEKSTVFLPLAISNQPSKNDPKWKLLKKEIDKIKIQLFKNSFMKLIMGKDKSWKLLHDDKFRYADLMIRWNIIQHFYPYYEEENLANTWKDRLDTAFQRAALIDSREEYLEIVHWLMAGVNDSHIETTRNAYFGGLAGSFIPVYFPNIKLDWCKEQTVYISKRPNPLEKIISIGDILVSISNVPIDTIIKNKLEYISASTSQGKMEKLINGNLLASFTTDSLLEIVVSNAQNKLVNFSIKTDQKNWVFLEEAVPPFIKKFDSIYYINLSSYGKESTYEFFKKHLKDIQCSKGVIIDVRGYPNVSFSDDIIPHFSSKAIWSGDFRRPYYYFPNQKNVVYVDEGNGYLNMPPENEYISVPVCVLINHKTVSYGETVVDMLDKHTNSTLIGQRTIGTNGDMTTINLPLFPFSMTAVKDFSGNHGKGISPDIYVSPTIDDIRNDKDIQLETAIEYLSNKKEQKPLITK